MNMSVTPSDDKKLDETIEESFPASDPPASTGETGVRIDIETPGEPDVPVREHPERPER